MKTTVSLIENYIQVLSNYFELYSCIVDMREIGRLYRAKDESLFSILSDAELEFLKELKSPKNRLQWIAGRYAVKSAFFKYKLERQSLLDLRCVDILRGADSAPYLLQYPHVNISITHSFPYCIGVVCEKKVGIDIEKIFQPEDSLIRYFYSNKEQELLMDFKDHNEYSIKSVVYWTRKEAVSKLLGLGMKMNFKELDTTSDELYLNSLYSGPIKLSSFICNDFCVSLAVG